MKIKISTNLDYSNRINTLLKRIYLNRCLDIKVGLNFYNSPDGTNGFNKSQIYCIFYNLLGKIKKSDFKNSSKGVLNFFKPKSIDHNFFYMSSPSNDFINILTFYQIINDLGSGKSTFVSVHYNGRFLSPNYFFYKFYNYRNNFDTLLSFSFAIKNKFQFVKFFLLKNSTSPLTINANT